MTPELAIVLSFIAAGFGGYLGAYLRQKGENLATREDIASITRTQEEIKAELATRSHFSRVRYDREFEIYRTVWRDLNEFFNESAASFVCDSPITTDSWKAWRTAGRNLSRTVHDNKPFYPSEVWADLKQLQQLCEDLTSIYIRIGSSGRQMSEVNHRKLKEEGERLLAEATAQREKVELIIRKRLDDVD